MVVSESRNSAVPLEDTVADLARFADPVVGLPRAAARWAIRRQSSVETIRSALFDPGGGGGGGEKREQARPLRESAQRASEKVLHLRHGFKHAFKVEQGMQQERQQRRAGAPAHPAEKQAGSQYFRHTGPIVLNVQSHP